MLIRILAVGMGIGVGGTACLPSGAFNSKAVFSAALVEEAGPSSVAAPSLTIQGQSLSLYHFHSRDIEFSGSTPSEDLSGASLCAVEALDCSTCTYQSAGDFTFRLSLGSGNKNFSYKTRAADGTESSCTTVQLNLTDLDTGIEPWVSGQGRFSQWILADGSGACGDTTSNPHPTECVPGALGRKLRTAYTSCSGLSLMDSLGAFEWKCQVVSGFATFIGKFKVDEDTQRISRIIDPIPSTPVFRQLRLTLTDSNGPHVGALASVWDDLILRAPRTEAAVETLAQGDTVYWIEGHTTYGYNITADGVTLIGSAADTLALDPGVSGRPECGMWGGESCVIGISGRERVVLELPLLHKGGTTASGIHLLNSSRVWITGANVTSTIEGGAGLSLRGSQTVLITDSEVSRTQNGFYLIGSGYVRVDGGRASRFSNGNGMFIGTGSHIEVNEFRVSNTGGTGLYLSTGQDLVVQDLFVSNARYGVQVQNSQRVTFSRFILSDLIDTGLVITGGDAHSYHLGTILRSDVGIWLSGEPTDIQLNNGVIGGTDQGLYLSGNPGDSAYYRVSNWVMGENTSDFSIQDSGLIVHTRGNLVFGSAPSCSIPGGYSGGFDPGSASCQLQDSSEGTSLAVKSTGAQLMDSFVGYVLSQDLANGSAGWSGSNEISYHSITDWFNFLNPWRAFGAEVATPSDLLSPDVPGAERVCESSDVCEVYDWSLTTQSMSNSLRRRTGDYISANTVTGSGRDYAHTTLQGSETSLACPAEVRGSGASVEWTLPSLSGGAPRTVLKLAVEKLFDGVGNDDGWCDASEVCIYTPNFGAYQGDASQGLGPCDQSGDVSLNPSNDTYLIEVYGLDGPS